jgi:hypothetical protein
MELHRPYLLSRCVMSLKLYIIWCWVVISSDTELETAILQLQLWVQWIPYKNPDLLILTDTARLMFTQYTSHGSVRDLDDIIALHCRVIHSMSLQGIHHFVLLNHLAEALCKRWYQLTQMNDIDESISLFEEALDLYTICDEHRAIILGNLTQALVYLNKKNCRSIVLRFCCFIAARGSLYHACSRRRIGYPEN